MRSEGHQLGHGAATMREGGSVGGYRANFLNDAAAGDTARSKEDVDDLLWWR